MKITTTLTALAVVVLATAWLAAPEATASNAIAKQEGLACTSCHDKPGSKLLTDRGKYYELMGSLEGYDQLQTTFTRCTACHVRKPGSLKLTRQGRQLQELLIDMEGLKELVLGPHPSASTPDDGPEATAADSGSHPSEAPPE